MALNFIRFCFPGVPGVECAFQVRTGGASAGPYAGGNVSLAVGDAPEAAAANRAALALELGLEAVAELQQVHGVHMLFEPAHEALLQAETAPSVEGDGLAASRPGLGLLIKTADCQPVFFAHESGSAVAALHVGWRGNRANFPAGGLRAFCARYGCAPEEVLAVRGPSLGPAAAEFTHFASEWGAAYAPWFDARRRTMDLWGLTRCQLKEAGMAPERIFSLDLCTASLPQFFSYRRDKITGRQANLIWRRELPRSSVQ
ncbi:MAG: polyphenol oxidase family protein [Deltaproteobacteria bacterium]|jgi:YfiH family protein|nr:polyphenol oxidase family protein [Deltaproteobacteria bacterium]